MTLLWICAHLAGYPRANADRRASASSLFRQLPNVPTVAESAVEGVQIFPWVGIAAPRATPVNIISRLSSDVREVVMSPEISKRFSDLGMEPFATTPEEFGIFIKQEVARWHPLIKELNIRLD